MTERRYFSLDDVQALVPELASIMARSVQLQQLLRGRAQELARAGYEVNEDLLAGRVAPTEPNPGTESLLAEAQGIYAAAVAELERVRQLGGDVKGADLVDFWSWRDGAEEVLLCWKLGEREVGWFHTLEGGFAGRTPVVGHRFLRRRGE